MALHETLLSWPALAGAFVLYVLALYTYRLTLHPLAKFPGSKLAAISLWYEFYWDGYHRGQYIFRIKEMHEKYGPIVRITPDELHINDPDFIPELMPVGGRRRDKYRRVMQLFGFTEAAISTVEHDVHRIRRGAMSRMFSKDSVRRLEPIMQANLEKLFARMEEFKSSGQPLNLFPFFSAFTNDLIAEYAFGLSYNWLEAPEFNKSFFEMITSFHEVGALAVQFNWVMPLINSLPLSILKKLSPGMTEFVQFKSDLMAKINRVCARHQEGMDDKTVFDEILDSNLSDFEKRPERLMEDAQNIAIAGTETTAWTLSVITFHLLRNPAILQKVKEELRDAIPDPDVPQSIKMMEQLPYLTAVITEGLRLSMGTSNRQERVCPDEVLVFTDGDKMWNIPKGTPVGMTTPLIHLNPAIFPAPLTFDPNRFLANPKLKRYLMSFSQGSRQCLGMNLAYAELYLVLSGLWRRFGGPESKEEEGVSGGRLELFETDETDVEMVYDLFVPYAKRESLGIRVRVLGS
ncbi:cytochrome P450-1 [Coleophoma crateriformis]|uniref:Cytochrome P450-1 n=1 Tax=Coleophoma crateriformis TaxID=565419 RepID=A0A3D8RPX1_9HELO|nr:cytochrome P450-1 [Coleophoma crateriformis]